MSLLLIQMSLLKKYLLIPFDEDTSLQTVRVIAYVANATVYLFLKHQFLNVWYSELSKVLQYLLCMTYLEYAAVMAAILGVHGTCLVQPGGKFIYTSIISGQKLILSPVDLS